MEKKKINGNQEEATQAPWVARLEKIDNPQHDRQICTLAGVWDAWGNGINHWCYLSMMYTDMSAPRTSNYTPRLSPNGSEHMPGRSGMF